MPLRGPQLECYLPLLESFPRVPSKVPSSLLAFFSHRSSRAPCVNSFDLFSLSPIAFLSHGIHIGDKMNFPVTFDPTTHSVTIRDN